jgi:hypothetical protein
MIFLSTASQVEVSWRNVSGRRYVPSIPILALVEARLGVFVLGRPVRPTDDGFQQEQRDFPTKLVEVTVIVKGRMNETCCTLRLHPHPAVPAT